MGTMPEVTRGGGGGLLEKNNYCLVAVILVSKVNLDREDSTY